MELFKGVCPRLTFPHSTNQILALQSFVAVVLAVIDAKAPNLRV